MKDIIKKILTEEKNKYDVLPIIRNIGLYGFLETTEISWVKLISEYGFDFLDSDIMIGFIKDLIKDYYSDENGTEIEPITISESDEFIETIEYITDKNVYIEEYQIFGDFPEYSGEYTQPYEKLNNDVIIELFDLVMDIYQYVDKI